MTARAIFKDRIAATRTDRPTLFSLRAQMLDQAGDSLDHVPRNA